MSERMTDDDLAQARKDCEQMRELATELAEALDRLADDEPCRLDHHGYCQEHSLTSPCHTAIAREVLTKARAAGVLA